MKHIIFALILSACTTEPTDEPPQANLDAVLDGERPLTCKSTVINECERPPVRTYLGDSVHSYCGERPVRKPTEEWADAVDLWSKCMAEHMPTERWIHDIDLWAGCAEWATPALTPAE